MDPLRNRPTPSEMEDFRTSRGLSQKDLARLLDNNHNTVCRWEKGDKPPLMLGYALEHLRQQIPEVSDA